MIPCLPRIHNITTVGKEKAACDLAAWIAAYVSKNRKMIYSPIVRRKLFFFSWPVIISTRCLTTRNLPWVCHHRITGSLYGTGRTDVNRLLCHRRLGCSLLCKAFSLAGSVTPGKAIAACITTYILYPSRVASYGIILSIRSISFPSARREEDSKGNRGIINIRENSADVF